LTPQRISLEPPESRLDPVSAFAITANLLPRPERPRQQSHLSAEEDSTTAQQEVRRHIAESAGLHGGSEVGQRLLFARGESQGHGLLGRAECLEDCCTVTADSEGEKRTEAEAEERADSRVCGDGAGGFAQGVAVWLLEAVFRLLEVRFSGVEGVKVFVLMLHVLFCKACQLRTHGLSGHCEGFGTHGGGVGSAFGGLFAIVFLRKGSK
jgi:hypothetical protein